MVDKFEKYERTQIAEMRPVELLDIAKFEKEGKIEYDGITVSISQADKTDGSPKKGDLIARNPINHDDVWLVAKKYAEDNFKKIEK